MKHTFLLTLLCTIVIACQEHTETSSAAPPPKAAAAKAAPPPQAVIRDGVQEIEIAVGADYQPASVALQPDLPVRIRFNRSNEGCGDEVVFPKLGIRKKLPANAVTTVELPPQKVATIDYTCGMNMMQGKLVVQ